MEINSYFCNKCNYVTKRKANYERHLESSKHKTCIGEISREFKCSFCNKSYVNFESLRRHLTRFHQQNNYQNNNTDEIIKMMSDVVKETCNLAKQVCEMNRQNVNINSNNTLNSNTNNFNINFYLNETCKNAMNINEFIDNMHIEISDLEETGRLGFVGGISRIIVNNLNRLDRPDRPIHCSDNKRLTIYIKNNDTWDKNNTEKLVSFVKTVAGKNMSQIYEWQKQNPEYCDPSSKCSDLYQKLLFESMSGSTIEECDENINKIIKNIARETSILKHFE
jgi:hypothetical protein